MFGFDLDEASMSKDLPESIGQATLTDDGTLELRLRAEEGTLTADAYITYAPDDPNYTAVKQHLEAAHGRLAVGRSVSVPPWPDAPEPSEE